VAALAAGILFSFEAASQVLCGDRERILQRLEGKYQETPVGAGLASNGGVIELLSTDDGSTWTIIISRADRMSCLVFTGQGWRDVDQTAAGQGL
jgi:hypothetical protein